MAEEKDDIKIGLALSGGGARGLAHIGVLKVFAAEGVPIHYLAGTSMGGIVAAGYAAGFSPETLEAKAMVLSKVRQLIRLVDLKAPRRGLVEGSRVRAFLTDLFSPGYSFEDLDIPLTLTAVDLVSGCEVTLQEGELLPAVMATSALPGVFAPVPLGPYRLVDGGVLNNLPVDLARRMGATHVIAVDVQMEPSQDPPLQELPGRPGWTRPVPDLFLDFYRVELIMVEALSRARLRETPPDLMLRPAIPPQVTMLFGFPRAAEIIAAGEQAALQALPEIFRLLNC